MTLPAGFTFIVEPKPETRGRPRVHFPERAATGAETKKFHRERKRSEREKYIAVLDMETDPFDNKGKEKIHPFAACLYSEHFEPVVIWEEDYEAFVSKVLDAIGALCSPYTIYAHNGGKFDFMFLVHKLRGRVSFKGRGIMSAKIGQHELRDSFHIIPERLANYKKDDFDYEKLRKSQRRKHKQAIIDYMVADCRYLLEIVKGFVGKFGLKISIGQAAMYELKKCYTVGNLGENTDATIRQWFFGGRVECLAGSGHFAGDYKLFDVNSMYPAVMASCKHPVSSDYTLRRKGGISSDTVFLDVSCTNYGALVKRSEENGTTATERYGRFLTSIWEFETALDLGLIENVTVNAYLDNAERTDFSKFVVPLYEGRQTTKQLLKTLPENSHEWNEAKKDDIFTKLLLNNAYGKFAQNPRRYKESWITAPGEHPETGYDEIILPSFECDEYWIWEKPTSRRRYNNVGTAASITGAARAVLLRAIHGAVDPIYCDTDSLICKKISGVEIDGKKLGAWDLEAEFSEVIVCGKKLYACKPQKWDGKEKSIKVKSKGAAGLTWADMLDILSGKSVETIAKGITISKTGNQHYMSRNISRTAPVFTQPIYDRKRVAA